MTQKQHPLTPEQQAAADAYNQHHFACRACIGGGQGRGERCATGAGLWAAYIGDKDPVYDPAVALVLEQRKASISMVQRHLKIRYNHAACLMVDMEKAGIVKTNGSNGYVLMETEA
jgi:DNA segregation ATPase FtsK/SpoIIIE-like protein